MFDVKKTTEEIIEFIRDYYKKNDLKGAVIGISGGKDSAVVAGLMVKALGSENVYGVWMPCHSKEEDKVNAKYLAKDLGITLDEYDLTPVYDGFVNSFINIHDINNLEFLSDSNINIKPRLRTATLYYYAAWLTKEKNGGYLVAGTSNKCELYVGYFTKGGDSVSDILTIADLTVDEVIAVGDYLGLPTKVVHKTPDDGLSGKSDEEKLGFKYSEVADVVDNEGRNTDEEVKQKILKAHERNMHKFVTPTYKKNK